MTLAVLLLGLGLALIVAEVLFPSFGVLSILATAAIVVPKAERSFMYCRVYSSAYSARACAFTPMISRSKAKCCIT